MRESTVVAGWRAEGIAEGRRGALLQARFPGKISTDSTTAIQAGSGLDRLMAWTVAAAKATSIEEFRILSGLESAG